MHTITYQIGNCFQPYEATIRQRNGRWYASVAYWKPSIASPDRETQSVGGVDVGINPLAVDSGGEHPNRASHYQPVQTANGQWQHPNPKAYDKLDFMHFKRRKRERLQLMVQGSRKFLDISVGSG